MKQEGVCKECLFFRGFGPGYGQCRQDDTLENGRMVDEYGFCGFYKKKRGNDP